MPFVVGVGLGTMSSSREVAASSLRSKVRARCGGSLEAIAEEKEVNVVKGPRGLNSLLYWKNCNRIRTYLLIKVATARILAIWYGYMQRHTD